MRLAHTHAVIGSALAVAASAAIAGWASRGEPPPPAITVVAPPPPPAPERPLRERDTRIPHATVERLCAGRVPCKAGLLYAGTDDGHELYVALLHLGYRQPEDCAPIERWLVVDGTTTFPLGESCDGPRVDGAWELVEVDQWPTAELRVHRMTTWRSHRDARSSVIALRPTGPVLREVGEDRETGALDRAWWTWATDSPSAEGGAIQQGEDGSVTTAAYQLIPEVELGDAFDEHAWRTTSITACALTLDGGVSALVARDVLYVELIDAPRRGRLHLDLELESSCEDHCSDEAPPCKDGWTCEVDVSLATGAVTGPATVTVHRAGAITRVRIDPTEALRGASLSLGGVTSASPRHWVAPLVELPAGVTCERADDTLVRTRVPLP